MIGIELVKDRKSKEPATKMLEEVLVRCWKRGLAIIGAGKSVIRICPPLIIEREELDIGLDILEAVLKETEK
jgi:4-aminobutyrate aminotransferase apoenzyme (EC 2.6.1.19)